MTDDETPILWPERPTCHDHDPFAQQFEPSTWRPAYDSRGFRTCSHCGSMHPEDLYSAVLSGARLGGSDWKYGWPHKFYVSEIPNVNVGKLSRSSSLSTGRSGPTEEDRARVLQWVRPGGKLVVEGHSLVAYNPEGATTHGKWYNTHLNDLNDTAFSAMSEMLMKQANIRFEREGDALKYHAPRAGYQKA